MSTPKIIILILSTNDPRYSAFKLGIRKTWQKDFNEIGIDCLFYEGGHDELRLNGDTLELPVNDNLHHCAQKLRLALEYVLENKPEIEVIYRTNLSSYLDVVGFNKFVNNANLTENSYGGVKGKIKIWAENFYRYKFI